MYFEVLQCRLVKHVHARLQRGEVTERGLARHTGISQPHLHNVLKGIRVLSPQMADLLLRHLHITLVDLLSADELAAHRPVARPATRFPSGDGLFLKIAKGSPEEAGGSHRGTGGEG